MSVNPWEVSENEYQKNLQLFQQLTFGQPYMDANTGRNALMRSNLPAPILAQIWALSDIDKDGRLDIREYSIAMRLAFNCLAGLPLPPQLPPSLLIVPSQSTPLHQSFPQMPPMQQAPTIPAWAGSRQSSVDHPERRMSQQSFGTYPTAPASINIQKQRTSSVSSSPLERTIFDGRQLENWNIPHQNKLKYSQLFNQLDKDRLGYLSTQAGRSALGLSGLSTNVLAHIWFLSDVNKDGKLSFDEYCISQFMIEMFKLGYALPQITPPELTRMCGISRSANNTPELEPGAEPPQKNKTPKTFEDKRHDNLAKGQAELERRRLILEEEENRRKAEIEKKEREEMARRERERQEKERQIELEREAELERQRLIEQQREEEEKKRRAEMEKRKEEEEKQRLVALEKAKIKQMTSQKQQESERLAQRQQREKTLEFQLQALDEKSIDIEADIGKAKDSIIEVTKSIEGLRGSRDEKVAKIQELQKENQTLAIESQEIGHQLLQMQSAHKETTNRKNELENLRKKRDAITKAIEESIDKLVIEKEKSIKQKEELEQKEKKYQEEVYSKLLAKREEYRKVFELLVHAQKQAHSKLAENEAKRRLLEEAQKTTATTNGTNGVTTFSPFSQQDAFGDFNNSSAQFDSAFDSSEINEPFGSLPNDPFTSSTKSQNVATAAAAAAAPHRPAPPVSQQQQQNPTIPTSESRNFVSNNGKIEAHDTYKCRALFSFEARSEDELSFEPGDVIIVFQSHAAEPGWKAGQLKDKVGWFPEAFVESIGSVPQHGSEPPIQNMPPNVTPSCSLDRIPEEEALRKAEIANVLSNKSEEATAAAAAGKAEKICQCVAQFQWRARNDDDLSFAKGDLIDVIEKQEMKWKGRKSNGEIGWFPKSYVKVTDDPMPSQTASDEAATNKSFVVASPKAAPQYDVVPSAVEQQLSFNENGDDWYIATYDFDAVETTDLALRVGDRILVTEKKDDWWKGKCNGKEGIFPANYVEKSIGQEKTNGITDHAIICQAKAVVDFVASAPNQLAIKVGDVIKVREKSAAGWWEGETIRNGVAMAGWFPGEYVKVDETMQPTSPIKESKYPTAIAMFDYEASQPDELSLKIGDTIIITDKSDAEWWTGHKPNEPTKSGLFPANYVQLQ